MTLPMAYEQMLAELESSKLEVVLAPSRRRDRRESDMIRVAICVPPTWYRKLCGRHQSSRGYRRGYDTKIKRENVLSTLRVLAAGRHTWSKYVPELRRIAGEMK